MKKLIFMLAFAALLCASFTPASEAALTLKAESLVFDGAAKDVVSPSAAKPDGKTDAVFTLTLKGTQAIKSVTLKNDTTGAVWNTTSGSGNLLIVKNSNGDVLNKNGRMAITPVAFGGMLTLIISDAAAAIPKDSNFTATVTLIDNAATSIATAVKSAAPAVKAEAAKAPVKAEPAKDAAKQPTKAEIFSFENRGESQQDLAGPAKKMSANGKNDVQFDLRMAVPNWVTVTGLKINAENGGKAAVWDTVSSSKAPLIVVVSGQNILNKTDGSLSAAPRADSVLTLLVDDRDGLLADPKTAVKLTVSLSDGKMLDKAATRGMKSAAKGSVVPEFRGSGKYDFTGQSEKSESNMNPDSFISITVNETGTITGLRVTNLKTGQMWDSVANNKNYLAVLLNGKGQKLNRPDGTLSVNVKGETEFHVAFDEDKAPASGPYKVTLVFSDGLLIEGTTAKIGAAAEQAAPAEEMAERGAAFVSKKPAIAAIDLVGKNKKKGASGAKDMALTIKVTGDGALKALVLTASNGKGWDTIASNNGRWLLGVREGAKFLNAKNGTIKIAVKGSKTLQLLMQDNGMLARKNGSLKLTATWGDGEVTESTLKW